MPSRYEEIMKTKPHLPFKMGYLTDAMVAKAEQELGETEEVKAKTIPELRKLIEKEPNLESPTDDAYLLQYLRARKYNVKKAFSMLQNYYQVKASNADLYGSIDLDMLTRVYGVKVISCLPYRDEDGCVVVMIHMEKWDPDKISMAEGIVALTNTMLFCVEDVATQVCGLRILLDVKEATMKHLKCIRPRFMSLFSKALRNSLPVRFKGIHIYNESKIFGCIWSVFKLLLSDKINRRVHFHSDNQKDLHKFIPKAILPSEFGGDNVFFSSSDWYSNEILSYFDKYQELTTYGYRT